MKLVAPEIEAYAVAHTHPVAELYERLRIETLAVSELARMQVGPLEGRLLRLLVQLVQPRLAIEIGTFTGYSALNIAEGLPEDGRLIACDVDPEMTAIARRYWDESPWGHKIELRIGPAMETLLTIEEPVDFAFIDADKAGYVGYYEELVPRLRSGGLIVADNVLWSGAVLDPQSKNDHALARFNAHVAADPRTEAVMLPIRDGITLARKL